MIVEGLFLILVRTFQNEGKGYISKDWSGLFKIKTKIKILSFDVHFLMVYAKFS